MKAALRGDFEGMLAPATGLALFHPAKHRPRESLQPTASSVAAGLSPCDGSTMRSRDTVGVWPACRPRAPFLAPQRDGRPALKRTAPRHCRSKMIKATSIMTVFGSPAGASRRIRDALQTIHTPVGEWITTAGDSGFPPLPLAFVPPDWILAPKEALPDSSKDHVVKDFRDGVCDQCCLW